MECISEGMLRGCKGMEYRVTNQSLSESQCPSIDIAKKWGGDTADSVSNCIINKRFLSAICSVIDWIFEEQFSKYRNIHDLVTNQQSIKSSYLSMEVNCKYIDIAWDDFEDEIRNVSHQ